jgi:hypothetical protein
MSPESALPPAKAATARPRAINAAHNFFIFFLLEIIIYAYAIRNGEGCPDLGRDPQDIGVYFQVLRNYQVLGEILTTKSKKSKK